MNIFIALRVDVAIAFRDLVNERWSVSDYFAAVPCRLETAPVGSPRTHFVAHGQIPDGRFSTLQELLRDATAGVRDAVDWQGRGQGNLLADARWAIATDGGELVAAYVLTRDGPTNWRSPRNAMALAGLVPVSRDTPDEVTQ